MLYYIVLYYIVLYYIIYTYIFGIYIYIVIYVSPRKCCLISCANEFSVFNWCCSPVQREPSWSRRIPPVASKTPLLTRFTLLQRQGDPLWGHPQVRGRGNWSRWQIVEHSCWHSIPWPIVEGEGWNNSLWRTAEHSCWNSSHSQTVLHPGSKYLSNRGSLAWDSQRRPG